MAGTSGLKRSLPSELRYQLDESKGKVVKANGSLCDIEDNEKRWLLIGIGLHTIISPLLRKYVTSRLDQLWQTLNNTHHIDTQQYPNHLERHGTTRLNYESINNNKSLGQKQQHCYDYCVKDPVDLSKLFLSPQMTHYTAFDDDCDVSALLAIVINSGICPPSGKLCAEKVRSEIRNQWAHCNLTAWDDTKYQDSVKLIEQLVGSLGLSNEEENEIVMRLKQSTKSGKEFSEVMEHLQQNIQEKLRELSKKMDFFGDKGLLPSAIYRMDERSRELYERALESGSEIKREIRVLVVGKKEAGKTSLIRRLLSRSLDDVKSTNGIEIHSVLSKDVIDWKLKTQTTDSRLLTGTIQVEKRSSDSEKNNLDRNSSNTGKFESGDEIANVQKAEKELLIDEEFINTEDSESTVSAAEKEDKINQEMIDLTNAEMNDENDIRISIWDFGGDEEFYHTHQIFLAEDVVFLVVTSLVDSAECSQGEFRFWFDTIHSLCKSAEKLNPPCIVIGTHKDKCQSEDDMNKNIETKLDTVEELSRHIHGQVHFISNKEYLAEEIDGIKMAIINAAKENEKWQTMHPLKFILLDKALERKRAESVDKPIVTFNEIKHTNDQLTNPLTDDELDLYLRYNHMLGHLVYYTDIPDYIVINPQWLGNIFRCIVTAEKFKYKLPGQYQDWKKMKNTGQVTDKLLQRIFETIEIDSEHRSYFLEVMKKFHILISRKVSGEEMSQSYFAPCMIRNNELNDLSGLFSGDPDDMSTCLCIECNFLPPFLFNYIIIFLCQQYDCARTTKGLPMFFSNGAIFNISQNMCKKLVVVRFNNIIQLQVLIFGELNSGSHSEIKTLIEQKFNEVIETYSIRIRYEWKWKCPRPTYTNCVGLLTYVEGDQTESYYCDRCGKSHSSRNDWTASLPVTSLTKKQLNFTRLGMLVTEVLADALYDLLPISTQHTKPRNQCDITYLYGEHRRQNIHVPSARHWGGVNKVGDIPSTSLAVGDDIERIRVMRNSLNHSSHYEIDDQEIDTLYKLIHDVLTRFHNLLNSTRTPTYMDRAEEIKQKTMVLSDMKTIEELVKKEPSIIVHHAENINIIHNHYSN